jgi:hypothetical protein
MQLRSVLRQSEGWVELETLIADNDLLTNDREIIKRYIDDEIKTDQQFFVADGIEIRRDITSNKTQLRYDAKKNKVSTSLGTRFIDDREDAWENISTFENHQAILDKMGEMYREVYHLPENFTTPISSHMLFMDGVILHGDQHGLLLGLKVFKERCYQCRRDGIVLTVRPSSYTLRVYNIPGERVNLYVTYIRVEETSWGPPFEEAKFFNMPVFLYSDKEYQLRTISKKDSVDYYLHKIEKGVPAQQNVIAGDSYFSDDTHKDVEEGCFQCSDASCWFPT